MASSIRVFTKRFFLYANIVAVMFFLLACLVPYLHPQKWWIISILGLAFPFLLLVVLLFFAAWFILTRPRYAIVSGVALLLGLKSILVFFAFNAPRAFQYKRTPGTIRIVSWNVARFVELKRNNNAGSEKRKLMLELLKKQDADILCLQEFHTSTNPAYYDNITPIKEELGYPYYYFSFDEDGDQHYYSSIIFSRFPIIDSGRVRYPRPTLPDVLLEADVLVGTDTISVFTTHLQSNQFGKNDYDRLAKIKTGEDSLVSNSKNIISKMKKAIQYRSIQADLVREVLDNAPRPVLLCADLNDVPNSYTYHRVKDGMQDAFLKKGFGIGRSFAAIAPTLRIDYIFADEHFKIHQFNRLVKNLSDHYMLVADVELKK